jgi:phage replication-related protein YjqB (UPF0714/DUF867 family)
VSFAQLLAHPGVEEVLERRGTFGFMAFHGGSLEEMTDVIARAAAERASASYYGVHQPPDLLAEFVAHVDVVITVHGYGRDGLWATLLVGGSNRTLASHLGGHLREKLPAYDVVDELERVPRELRGLHPDNPVNRPRDGGAQLELPPRVRGMSPLWWDWEGPGLAPHTERLVDALVAAATTWNGARCS